MPPGMAPCGRTCRRSCAESWFLWLMPPWRATSAWEPGLCRGRGVPGPAAWARAGVAAAAAAAWVAEWAAAAAAAWAAEWAAAAAWDEDAAGAGETWTPVEWRCCA